MNDVACFSSSRQLACALVTSRSRKESRVEREKTLVQLEATCAIHASRFLPRFIAAAGTFCSARQDKTDSGQKLAVYHFRI